MKSHKAVAAVLFLFSVASVSLPAAADGVGKHCGDKHHAAQGAKPERYTHHEFWLLGQELALTDAQKATLKAQREANDVRREALHAKVADARTALAAAVDAGANDAELNVLADSLGKAHAEQALARAGAKKAFLAVLTDEQRQALVAAKAKRVDPKAERKDAREAAKS